MRIVFRFIFFFFYVLCIWLCDVCACDLIYVGFSWRFSVSIWNMKSNRRTKKMKKKQQQQHTNHGKCWEAQPKLSRIHKKILTNQVSYIHEIRWHVQGNTKNLPQNEEPRNAATRKNEISYLYRECSEQHTTITTKRTPKYALHFNPH